MTNETDSFYDEEEVEKETSLDDVLAMDLESLDKEIPVEVEQSPYLLTKEEEDQLTYLLQKKNESDTIMQTFKSLQNGPSEEQIEVFKAKHGDNIYLISLSDSENFLFRPLKRQEWRELMQRFEKSKLTEQQRTEGIVMSGVIWPTMNQANINILTAGAPETIRNLILEASNFMEPERAVTLVRKL